MPGSAPRHARDSHAQRLLRARHASEALRGTPTAPAAQGSDRARTVHRRLRIGTRRPVGTAPRSLLLRPPSATIHEPSTRTRRAVAIGPLTAYVTGDARIRPSDGRRRLVGISSALYASHRSALRSRRFARPSIGRPVLGRDLGLPVLARRSARDGSRLRRARLHGR